MSAGRARLLIIGIGNVLLGDEGLGVHVARSLLALPEGLPTGVEVLEAGTALFDFLPELSRYPRVILVDAIRMGREPGLMYRAELDSEWDERLQETPPLSLHGSDLLETLAAARLLGLLPERLTLLGAEPERVEFTLELSPTLRRTAARMVSELLAEGGAQRAPAPVGAPKSPSDKGLP